MDVSKNRGFPPKWMVKIRENPMNKWMIWGENPPFSETPHILVMKFLGALKKKSEFLTESMGPIRLN